jgi:hypothetical protein
MGAKEAIPKRHGMRAGLGSMLRTFSKMIHTDFMNLAIRKRAGFRRRFGLSGHGISPRIKQEGLVKPIISIGGTDPKL